MNILVIDDEWPSKSSGKFLRIENLYKRLKNKGSFHFLYIGNQAPCNIELIDNLFSSVDAIRVGNDPPSFGGRLINLLLMQPGDYIPWSNAALFKRIREEIRNKIKEAGISVVHVYSYFTAQYCADLDTLAKIWDVGDSLYLALKRMPAAQQAVRGLRKTAYARKIMNYEKKMIRQYDKTVFVSCVDAEVHHDQSEKVSVIPNGVDAEYFAPMDAKEEYPSLIFTGHMNFGPNIKAVLYFTKEVLPTIRAEFPDLTFYVVGADPTKEVTALNGKDGVVVTGFVDDIRPFMAKATVFIAPLLSGSGIKNKLLQAMAMGKPIVTTALGVEAIECAPDTHLVVSDTAERFADSVIELLKDRALRVRLGNKSRSLAEVEYNWHVVVDKYESLLGSFQPQGVYR